MAAMGRKLPWRSAGKPSLAFRRFVRRIARVDDAPDDAEEKPGPSQLGGRRLDAGQDYGHDAKETERVETRRRPLPREFVSNPVPASGEAQFFRGLELIAPSPRGQ